MHPARAARTGVPPPHEQGGRPMTTRRIAFALAIALPAAGLGATGAIAANFKWANDGDVRAMDPYTFNETVQNSFLANIYERLIQHSRTLGLEPALAVAWEATAPNT